jgi:UDP-N-acetylmuramate--alanine ligase
MFARRDTRIHFVGVGGIGMSGIAEVLINIGYTVSGTDLKESDTTRRLGGLGARIAYGHDAAHLADCEVVVISSAVRPNNPEVTAARQRGIPVIPRAEMLAELMRLKYGVAVAGSHGKTTTTSLIATVLRHAGLDPTAVIGGKLPQLGSNARLGQGEILVAEADESDGSFMKLAPAVAVVTNIDPEHLDHYGSIETLRRTFVDFINKVPFYGLAVLCVDHPTVQGLLPQIDKRYVTYGLAPLATYRAADLKFAGLESSFIAHVRGRELGRVVLPMPGRHNVMNALAVLAVADFLGVSFDAYGEALRTFQGVGRRFTVRGEAGGVMVVDDYGHHPAEIRATLEGARAGYRDRRIVAAFQPHRYSRTRDLMSEFACAFNEADLVFVCDVYAAGEEPITGVTSARLVEEMRASGHPRAVHVAQRADLPAAISPELRVGDIVITLGAGDVWQVGETILQERGS